jgi:hypothetical protein
MVDPNAIHEAAPKLVWLVLVFVFVWSFWPLILIAMLSRVKQQLRRLQDQVSRLPEPEQQDAHHDQR